MAKKPSEPEAPVRRPARPPAPTPVPPSFAPFSFTRADEVFAEPPAVFLAFAHGAIVGIFAIAQSLATPDMERGIARAFQSAAAVTAPATAQPPTRHLRLEP